MRSTRIIQGIDSHTAGCPLRLITSGFGPIRGSTMVEKRADLMTRDWLRQLVLFEPRGSFNMPAAVLTEACSPDADIGMIILEPDTYPPMCGHCAMAVATISVEAGYITAEEGETLVRLDTPAGVVPARVRVENGRAASVTLEMPASFLYRRDVQLTTPSFGTVCGDIAFGGDFYFIVEAADLGLTLTPGNAWALVGAAAELRAALKDVPVQHPTLAHVNEIYQIEIVGPGDGPSTDGKNVVVCPPTVIDRSPCGTGTASRMAMLHAKGELGVGDSFRHAGILDTVFRGEIHGETKVGDLPAIQCTVTGSAYLTGSFNFFLDPHDPFQSGFRLTGV
ncbi:Proline racemase [Hartmannibacter diazotrophicus]|uniref:4-hydroxyproline epimerase n=1 Tax=Hartmannibacter diazotrophicus TaxID=1482074 RepID=A0A2C9D2A7_9HYPH|nr:proline racemase family protein [Hartmannibacter diazotrophicus]SON54353.1 Proline racemase [Hartmannibacter diazotrophicus]